MLNASDDSIFLNGNIETNGGSFTTSSNEVFFQAEGNQSLVTNNGAVSFGSSNIRLLKSGGTVTINSGDGNLNLGSGDLSYVAESYSISEPVRLLNWSGRKDVSNNDLDKKYT